VFDDLLEIKIYINKNDSIFNEIFSNKIFHFRIYQEVPSTRQQFVFYSCKKDIIYIYKFIGYYVSTSF